MSALAGLIPTDETLTPDALRARGAALLAGCKGRGGETPHIWCNEKASSCIGARSLSTLDLTPDGVQPIASHDQRFIVALDGYIAGSAALRRELEEAGTRFRGHGDAELVAEGAAHWGLNRLLQKIDGAFAIALWDNDAQALHLVRDRFGLKPLYVHSDAGGIAFASDPRAFGVHIIDKDSAAQYLALGAVFAPRCLYAGVTQLPPGHRLMLQKPDALPETEAYWSPASCIEESTLRSKNIDADAAQRLARQLAADAVRLDASFALLDDGSEAARLLSSHLERAAARPVKMIAPKFPDGAGIQRAFDALALAAEPVCDPAAISLWHCLHDNPDTTVIITASGLGLNTETAFVAPLSWRQKINRVFSRLRPRQSAHDIYADKARHWVLGQYPKPVWNEPRLDLTLTQRLSYYNICAGLIGHALPALDRIAGLLGFDLRAPGADARLLDMLGAHADIRLVSGKADLAVWMRGPLRPRIAEWMQNPTLTRIGIEDTKLVLKAWDDFIKGDDTQTMRIWVYATLAAWVSRAV